MNRQRPTAARRVPPELAALGVDSVQLEAFCTFDDPRLQLCRIAVEAQAQFALLEPPHDHARAPASEGCHGGPAERQREAEAGEPPVRWGELSGNLRAAQKSDPLARPAVGDFVFAEPSGGTHPWRIHGVLPRRTRFVRQSARRRLEPQIMACNVDVVLICTTPNDDFSPRRLERYLTTVHTSGAQPAVILNKMDLAEDPESWLRTVREVALDAPVLGTSAVSGEGLSELERLLAPGRTVALVGSSGVGKSSLTNALLGTEKQTVAAIRAADDKGRHTTTHRELFRLPKGPKGAERGLLVDTPGMRALGLWAEPEALLEAFADIRALAQRCRFRDCRHRAEPDCAVRAEEAAGTLSSGRLASFLRLTEEVEGRTREADRKPRRRR